MKYIIYNFLLKMLFISLLFSQDIYNGMTLFTPYYTTSGSTTFLINNGHDIIHTWTHMRGPASMPYLMPDSSIVYPYKVSNPTMNAGGVGGGIQSISWSGNIIWDYTISDENYQHHHDICPLPNQNILLIVWERKTAEEAYNKGRQIINNFINQMWVPAILELEPSTGNVVWEWHAWNHLIQDVDSTLDNYGIISEHPELIDINYGEVGNSSPGSNDADWMHVNSIDYNEILDQIIFSSRNLNEIYIIDHSTTIEEASSNIGGNTNMGGNILYRWGNPVVYQRGDVNDQKLYSQHGVNWITEGYPNEGNIIFFNNGIERPEGNFSSIDILIPPINSANNYNINQNEAFGPITLLWSFNDNESFFSHRQCGAYQLINGNILVTVSSDLRIFEVNLDGEVVWNYFLNDGATMIPRAMKYGFDYLNSNLIGDLNNDQIVNILDIVQLINIILSNSFEPNADLNNDGSINVLDIVQLINIILN